MRQMRIEGTLSKWTDERGFGFITPTQGGPEVFVHISAFPRDGVRPTLGERLSFEVEVDGNGKRRAIKLLCPQRPTVLRTASSIRRPVPRRNKNGSGLLNRIIPLLIVIGGVYGYSEYSRLSPHLSSMTTQNPEIEGIKDASSASGCDGRTHCSQMTSCNEATFFLRHCPNTQMDGDGDGVPCEQQWCR